jgi:hypothetical protein
MRKKQMQKLAAHFQEEGRFSPFTYTIGLESSLRDSEDSQQNYPIPKPVSEETFRQFIVSLTFFHEAVHFGQFISTAFGLRTLRCTLIVLKHLLHERGWQLPLESLIGRMYDPPSERFAAAQSFLLFLDAMDQMRLHQDLSTTPADIPEFVMLEFLPWSPHFFLLEDQGRESREKFARHLRGLNAHVRKLPVISVTRNRFQHQIVVNAASLAEGYALVTELNHIVNALRLPLADALGLASHGNKYVALMSYLLDRNYCSTEHVLFTLTVCIDAALMYVPSVLYNVPWDGVDQSGRCEQYPGETFISLCEALPKTKPVQGFEDVARFHKDLCANAGLPDPQWMAEKSLEVARAVRAKAPAGSTPLLANAIDAHMDALEYRCAKGPAFPSLLTTTECIYDLLHKARRALTFYNLHTRAPDFFDPRKIDTITIHSILLQAISQPSIQCPLKLGNPFFCNSAAKEDKVLCVWKHEFGTSECLLDVLERACGFVSATE